VLPILLLAGLLATAPALAPSGAAGAQTPAPTPVDLLDAWVELWGTYDLDRVDDLFVQDDRLTYFSSETEGLIQGFDRIVEHHQGFGFESGGSDRDQRIWVEEVEIVEFGDTALIGAIWFFGAPGSPESAQRGPMTVLAIPSEDGYRIAHMHFATYERP
jgi:ketosteroid isomerase-like protein